MTLQVKVNPSRPVSRVTGEMSDGTLKVDIAAPPDKGRANEELCSTLATHFGVQRDRVTIVTGHSARRKLVRIDGGR